MTFESLRTYLSRKPSATEDFPFNPTTLVARVGNRIFALIMTESDPLRINLKCDPLKAEFLRDLYPAISPGYHMDKRHWNTLVLDGSIPDREILAMIDESYALVVRGLPKEKRPPAV